MVQCAVSSPATGNELVNHKAAELISRVIRDVLHLDHTTCHASGVDLVFARRKVIKTEQSGLFGTQAHHLEAICVGLVDWHRSRQTSTGDLACTDAWIV